MRIRSKRGFTLIELLIVVAIIAILAAIAVPNFLEAQVRSKVGRVKNDMRTLAVALESYRVDINHYPPDFAAFWPQGTYHPVLRYMTTPVAYVTSIPPDAFNVVSGGPLQYFAYVTEYQLTLDKSSLDPNHPAKKYGTSRSWVLSSYGPDRTYSGGNTEIYGLKALLERTGLAWGSIRDLNGAEYDATNGTVSWGDIVRVGP